MKLANSLLKELEYCFFLLKGKKPFDDGYTTHKEKALKKVFSRKDFNPRLLENQFGIGIDERIVEYPWLFYTLPNSSGTLLDAGSVLNFDFILAHSKLQEKKITIMTLYPESRCYCEKGISYQYGDLRQTCFKEAYFDFIVCLSTIEHIGFDNTKFYTKDPTKKENCSNSYLIALSELKRILKPGGILYLSIPFGKYESFDWLQVFNGVMLDKLLSEFAPSSYIEDHYRYYIDGWRISSRHLSQDAGYVDRHNNPSIDKRAPIAAEAVVCLALTK